MTTSTTSPLSQVQSYYALIDAGRLEEAFEIFAPDVVVRFGDQPEIHGRTTAAEYVSGMVVPVASKVRHEIVRSYEIATAPTTTVVCEAVVTYTMRHSGKVIPHNAVTISEVDERGLIVAQRNVGDLRPVIDDHREHSA